MTANSSPDVTVQKITSVIRRFYFEHHAYPSVNETEKQLREERQLIANPEIIERVMNSVKAVEHGLRTGNLILAHRGTWGYSVAAANLIDAAGKSIVNRKPPVQKPVLKERNPEEVRRELIERLMQLRENARDPTKKFPRGYKDTVNRAVKTHPDSEVQQLARDILSAMKARENRPIQIHKRPGGRRKPPLRRPPGSH